MGDCRKHLVSSAFVENGRFCLNVCEVGHKEVIKRAFKYLLCVHILLKLEFILLKESY